MVIVLTQNIWGGAPFWNLRRRSLARRISRLRPDIIGLQEVHSPNPEGEMSQAATGRPAWGISSGLCTGAGHAIRSV